jgi:hypothetical protein
VNVRDHLPGASVLNIECPDGAWTPLGSDGNPVSVTDAAGRTQDRIRIAEGDDVTVTDPSTGEAVTLVCVPAMLPEFGDGWVGQWVGLSIIENGIWHEVLQDFTRGFAETDGGGGLDENTDIYKLVIDPYGVIRWYEDIAYFPPAVEQDDSTGDILSLVQYSGGFGYAPGTPAKDSYIVVSGEKPTSHGTFGETVVLRSPSPSLRIDGHDITVLPNGNYLVIAYENVEETRIEYDVLLRLPAGCPQRSVSELTTIMRTRLLEYSRDGKLLRTWKSEDHLPPTVGAQAIVGVRREDGKTICSIDSEHPNAVDADEQGRVVVGFRNHPSDVIMIDWASGELIWELSGEGSKALDVTGDRYNGPSAAHDATISVLNGATHISLFDNNTLVGPPRYVRYRIDEGSNTADLVVEIFTSCTPIPCFSGGMGSAAAVDASSTELLVNLGIVVSEDVTVPLDGRLLHYRDAELVGSTTLDGWWVYKASLFRHEPWSR